MIRINDLKCKATMKAAAAVSVLFLLAAVAAFGQQQINLTANPTTATMPDGTIVPMWGYFCGTAVTGSTATCAALDPNTAGTPPTWAASTAYVLGTLILDSNGNVQKVTTAGTSGTAAPSWATTAGTTTQDAGTLVWTMVSSLASYLSTSGSWSPVVITVPTGATGGLTINLTNNLSFTTSTTPNNIPTSIVIVGQVGGGLGGAPTTTPSPDHSSAQGCVTWFIANTPPGTPCASTLNSTNPALASFWRKTQIPA